MAVSWSDLKPSTFGRRFASASAGIPASSSRRDKKRISDFGFRMSVGICAPLTAYCISTTPTDIRNPKSDIHFQLPFRILRTVQPLLVAGAVDIENSRLGLVD